MDIINWECSRNPVQQGRSDFDERSVLSVREHGKMVRTPLVGFLEHSHEKNRGQVILRHTDSPAYRCFLPDLAGFTRFCCTGPSPFSSIYD